MLKIILIVAQGISFAAVGGVLLEQYYDDPGVNFDPAAVRCMRAFMVLFWAYPLAVLLWSSREQRPSDDTLLGIFIMFLLASIALAMYALIYSHKDFNDAVMASGINVTNSDWHHIVLIVSKVIFVLLAIVKSIIKALWEQKMTEFLRLIEIRILLLFLGVLVAVLNDPELNRLHEQTMNKCDEKLAELSELVF